MSLSSDNPKFRVAICGAGIGGLVLAITIGKFANHDVQVDLYEAHNAITTNGAGIVMSSRTMEVLKTLGLSEDVARVSSKRPSSDGGTRFRKSDIPEGGYEWFQRIPNNDDNISSLHRVDFIDVLKRHLPSLYTLHFNKRLVTYDKLPTGSIALHFSDESTENTDVLIGADGIRSSARKTLFETIDPNVVDPSKIRHYTDASWTGILTYRAIVPAAKILETDPGSVFLGNFTTCCGKGKHVVLYPVSQGTLINVTAIVSNGQKASAPFEGRWVSDVSREEVEEAFQDFEPAVRSVLKCFENPSRWALHVVNKLPLSTYDRVGLIGDACHAMTPYLGAGAGQAMEDAFVLGRLLAHPLTTLDNVPAALRAYQDVRLQSAQSVAYDSLRMGLMLQLNVPEVYDGAGRANEREEMDVLKDMILSSIGNNAQGSAIFEWQQAERNLKEILGSCNSG